MPEKATVERAQRAKRRGASPSTQAGEFVREEIHHIREGEHGARSAKQAIAIGLSKARAAGVDIPDEKGRRPKRSATSKRKSPARARASLRRLTRAPRRGLAPRALAPGAPAGAGQDTDAALPRRAERRPDARTRFASGLMARHPGRRRGDARGPVAIPP